MRRPEDVKTAGEAFNLLLDQDDVIYLYDGDRLATRRFVANAVAIIERARVQCAWYQFLCKRELRQSTLQRGQREVPVSQP